MLTEFPSNRWSYRDLTDDYPSGISIHVRHRLEITEEALEQLRALPKDQRRKIGMKLDALQTDLTGDVKKLAAQGGKYRLRVGTFRVLFTLGKDLIVVHVVKDRRDAYRD